MDVILLERIERLGQMGDVVKVKSGYARNYLLPQKKALRATPDNLAYFETQRAQLEAVNLKHRDEAAQVAEKLDGYSAVLIRQAGESGQLYGSVTTRDVAAALGEAGFTLERHQIQLDKPIKALGIYDVRVSLHPEVAASVTINVAKSPDEAEAQVKAAAEADEAAKREAETRRAERKSAAGKGPGKKEAKAADSAEAADESETDAEAAAAAGADEKPADEKPGDQGTAVAGAEDAAAQPPSGAKAEPAAEQTPKKE